MLLLKVSLDSLLSVAETSVNSEAGSTKIKYWEFPLEGQLYIKRTLLCVRFVHLE